MWWGILRVPSSMITNTDSVRKLMVTTVKKSHATIALHGCGGTSTTVAEGLALSLGAPLLQVLPHGPRRNPDAEFQASVRRQCGPRPRLHSQHLGDQPTKRWSSGRVGLPAPKETKPLAVPTGQRSGLHSHQHTAAREESAQCGQQPASGVVSAVSLVLRSRNSVSCLRRNRKAIWPGARC